MESLTLFRLLCQYHDLDLYASDERFWFRLVWDILIQIWLGIELPEEAMGIFILERKRQIIEEAIWTLDVSVMLLVKYIFTSKLHFSSMFNL